MPLSGQPRNAVPSCTPSAPRVSAAAIPRPSMTPPACSTGSATCVDDWRARARPRRPGRARTTRGTSPGGRPPRSPARRSRRFPPRSSATASSTVVAVPRITQPASLTCSRGGMPKVKLNTGTRSSATTASCSSTRPGGGSGGGASGSGSPSSAPEGREHGVHRRDRVRIDDGLGERREEVDRRRADPSAAARRRWRRAARPVRAGRPRASRARPRSRRRRPARASCSPPPSGPARSGASSRGAQ